MTTESKSAKRLAINLTDAEVINEFNWLKGEGKSNPEFIAELLECYKAMMGKNCSPETDDKLLKNMLLPSQDDKKSTPEEKEEKRAKKEANLRQMFELEDNDPLSVTEAQILEVASKISGKSILEMSVEGRLIVAKSLIGKAASVGGQSGKADARIEQTYEFLKQSGQKITVNRLTTLAGTNRKTIEGWLERKGINLE